MRQPVPVEAGISAVTEPTGRSIRVAHPQYPKQRHRLDVYSADGTQPPTVSAAGEVSSGVWGFFVPA